MNNDSQAVNVISIKGWQWFLAGVLMTTMLFGGVSACYQGRDFSRWTGVAQKVGLPEDVTSYDKIVSISFHKNGEGATIKDVTYMGLDGKMRSKEYRDWGLLEGEIIWEITAKQ